MSDELGALCIVLHGHLPYVLHHGSYPHGEAWLFEAAAETYLPILDMVGECALLKARPALTIGLTPVLLEQLSHDRFKAGFADYLTERAGRAAMDFSRALFDEGVMATGIAFPTVPEGKARIRAIVTSEHTRAQLDQALETMERVARRMGIL